MKRNLKTIIMTFIFVAIMILFQNTSNASDLNLDNLKFEAQINQDASVTITEYWDIYISETNTIYKTFKLDKTKFSNITDVTVSEITNGIEKQFSNINNEMYHVTEECYYGLVNSNGDFEIAWGVGLDNQTDVRSYKISYTITDAIAKYQDSAELYWQFVGGNFEIPCTNVSGIIRLPEYANKKEDILVWGHTEELNGTIYATDTNKIEFELDGLNPGNYLEVRILFPTEMIVYARRGINKPIIQEVIDEETVWANEANKRRERKIFIENTIAIIICSILNIILFKKAIKYRKQYKQMEEKIKPEIEFEYFRELPRIDATPGEALLLDLKAIRELKASEIGKVFSSTLLNLTLKNYINIEVGDSKEEIFISKGIETNDENLLKDEKVIYNFIVKGVLKSKDKATVKELKKYISSNSMKVAKMKEDIDDQIKKQLLKNKLYYKDAVEENNNIRVLKILCVMLTMFSFTLMLYYVNKCAFPFILTLVVLTIYVNKLLSKKKKKLNIFTQDGVDEIAKWKGLKKYMEDFSLLKEKEIPDLILWEKFLVFATVFGISKKVINQLKIVYPNFDTSADISNYKYMYLLSTTDFERNFSKAVSTSISNTYSSATGGGGGFSGGGGGGRRPVAAVADAKTRKFLRGNKNEIYI